VVNISNFTSEDNPRERLACPAAPTRPTRRTQPSTPAGDRTGQARPDRILAIAGQVLAIAGRVVLSWLGAIPRRLGDRLFALNDTEAYWRGWQITKTQGGLGRSYRDPRFDTLAECPKCRGAGLTAALPCLPCLGTGRITRGEVS
jgi:hypothetical protein